MTDLKPAYLVHGDDHGAIAERRAGLRALATAQGGEVELLEGEAASPEGVARALAAMTLAAGRRVLLVEGVERWRPAEVQEHLAPAMDQMPPDTTLGLFAREEGRATAPAALHEAVRRAGGQVVAQMNVKPRELPRWVRAQAARLGLSLDEAAAKALIGHVGERQQRLLRELEKLALSIGPTEGASQDPGAAPARIGVDEVDRLAAPSAELKVFSLADALVAGRTRSATLSYLRLRQQGERLSGLTYLMARRLREGLARTDSERLRGALCALADLELDSRGGAPIGSSRSALAPLSEDTVALRAIESITA